jgi:hypothetical protein
MVGYTILPWVHRFAPNFPFAPIFERFRNDVAERAAEEDSRAMVARVIALLLERVNRHTPGA